MSPRRWAPVALVGVLLVASCSSGTGEGASAPDPAPDACASGRTAEVGTEHGEVRHDGADRGYELSVPESYDGTMPTPLIVNLHGFSSNAEQQVALSDLPARAGDRGYLVVTPQALEVDVPLTTGVLTTTFWNIDPAAVQPGFEPADDLGFLDALVDELEVDLCVDTDREYVTGMSNGAGMTMGMICRPGNRFAAAAPVAGVNLVVDCEPPDPVSVIAFHGDADPLIPYEGGAVVGQDYEVASVEGRLADLAALAGCDPDPVVSQPFDDIETSVWSACDDGVDVELTTVLGGGHTWPGGTFEAFDEDAVPTPEGQEEFVEGFDFTAVAGHLTDAVHATELMLDFFDAHTLPSP